MITVVNVKHDKRPEVVYIGRWMPGRKGSPLGNPFKADEHNDPIGLFQVWLAEKLQSDTPQRREIERLAALHRQGKNLLLGCWCKPGVCHGDVVKAVIEEWKTTPAALA